MIVVRNVSSFRRCQKQKFQITQFSPNFVLTGSIMDDERCCGTGTCIINAEGYCWCGQKWDGEKMCFPASEERTQEHSIQKSNEQLASIETDVRVKYEQL
jgi:hypothetical protein